MTNTIAYYVNVALISHLAIGLALTLSAFVCNPSQFRATNNLIVGVVITLFWVPPILTKKMGIRVTEDPKEGRIWTFYIDDIHIGL